MGKQISNSFQQKEISLYGMVKELSLLKSLQAHNSIVWHVAWSPCGNFLASCGEDKIIFSTCCHFFDGS